MSLKPLARLIWKGSVLQPFCRAVEPVCGHNGETYSSVCAAYADRVAVDYPGHCQAVGVLSDFGFHTECAFVRCPQLAVTGCKPVFAPGTLAQGRAAAAGGVHLQQGLLLLSLTAHNVFETAKRKDGVEIFT